MLEENPLCVMCTQEGRTCLATDLDHIIPLQKRADLAFERTNLQPLCRHHHIEKTANAKKSKGLNADGVPLARLRAEGKI